MPEEVKLVRESNGKFGKDIYVENKVVGKLMEDCVTDHSKPAKAKMVTEMINGCYEEIILLMGNDGAKELEMEGELIVSDGSDASSIDDEPVIGSMVFRKELKLNDDVINTKLSSVCDNGAKNKEFQNFNETDGTSPMVSSVIQEPNSLVYDQENEQKDHDQKNAYITSRNEESVNISQHCSGDIPYSGSVSLRSASSTASTQSFAFPILPQEWNSYTSPVRMATPDKKLSIKQKLWNKKMNWICCIF